MNQLSIFDQPTGEELRDAGIQQAVMHADEVTEKWSEEASRYLDTFLIYNSDPFMAEQFREYCEKYRLPTPPSLRAFGGVITRALKDGKIKKVGYGTVNNPKAHCTPAAIWQRNF